MSLPQYNLIGNLDGAAPSHGFATINLNDQVNLWVEADGFDIGAKQTTWDEQVSYAGGANVQTHVVRSGLVPVTIPMWAQGSSVTNLEVNVLNPIWAMIEASSSAYPISFTLKDTTGTPPTSTIPYCSRPATMPRGNEYWLLYRQYFTLVLMRLP